MPNRVVREGILSSKRVDQLDDEAEVFYRRLLSVVDDFGRYHADCSLLVAALYPLRIRSVTDEHIERCLSAVRDAGLVAVYAVGGSRYLEVLDFRQQLRAKRSKFPDPSSGFSPTEGFSPNTTPTPNTTPNTTPNSSAKITRAQTHSTCAADAMQTTSASAADAQQTHSKSAEYREAAKRIIAFLNERAGRAFEDDGANREMVVARLKDGATEDQCRQVIALKVRKWKGDENMNTYLRPATLFNRTKFAQYVGELAPAQREEEA